MDVDVCLICSERLLIMRRLLCAAFAGRLGSGCDGRHVCSREQQIQTDGFRLYEVQECFCVILLIYIVFS